MWQHPDARIWDAVVRSPLVAARRWRSTPERPLEGKEHILPKAHPSLHTFEEITENKQYYAQRHSLNIIKKCKQKFNAWL
jgi:hypothetical protein